MKKIRLFIGIMLIVFFLSGCASIPPIQKSLIAYRQGNFNQSEAVLKNFVETKKTKRDPQYPLMLLTLADAQFRLGDYQSALKSYNAAVKSMTGEISGLSSATQILKSELKRLYRGKPHDLAFAHYYMGICLFQLENFESARIEFSKARLEDKGEKAGQEDDISSIHFMEGLCYKRLGNINDALVSFRKVTELQPEFPYGWYELTIASDKLGFNKDADQYWNRYRSLIPEDLQLSRTNDSPCLFIILDLGKGPYKTADIIVGEFATYQKGKYLEKDFELSLSGSDYGPGYKLDDTYFQAKSEGGFAGDVTRKVVSTVAKTAIKQIVPFGGLLVGKSGADTRVWYSLSGEIFMTYLPAKQNENYILSVDFFGQGRNKKKNKLDSFTQHWYYISAQEEKNAKPLYLISVDNLHNLNVDHISIKK